MKRACVFILSLLLLAPYAVSAQTNAAERAWKPFFTTFRAAVKRRDREALKKMLAPDFLATLGGIDDANGDGDIRDDVLLYWDEPQARRWEALERTLAMGTVPYTYRHDAGDKTPKRVAPPAANVRRSMARGDVDWYAIFEFRADGRWYCTDFVQCCD